MKYEDILNKDKQVSLVKLSGKKVVDITGYISNEFGHPSFLISQIVFEDGSHEFVGGEHDFPYIEGDVVSYEEMRDLYEQSLEHD